MTIPSQQSSQARLSGAVVEAIGEIHSQASTGVLEIRSAASRRRFFFVEGELFLPGGHSLAQRLGHLLAAERTLRDGGGTGAEPDLEFAQRRSTARNQLQAIVGRIVDVLVEWDEVDCEFSPTEEAPMADLIGPLPTAYLIMESSVRGLDAARMLRRLGGEACHYVADRHSKFFNQLWALDSSDMFLLSRAESELTVGELLKQMPASRESTLRSALRLVSVGLLRRPATEESSEDLDSAELPSLESEETAWMTGAVDRFLERVSPATLDHREAAREAHRRYIADLLGRAGGLNHYELLEITSDAEPGAVHQGFMRVAAKVHPKLADDLGLAGREEALRLLFERATLAYLTLTDPARRAEYNRRAGVESVRSSSAANRNEEQRDLARNYYRRALGYLESGDFHFALELARQAVRADPRAEFFALLGNIQARNPNWVVAATESYRQAIKLDPENAGHRIELAGLLERTGQVEQARSLYRVALRQEPINEEAQQGLERVAGGKFRGKKGKSARQTPAGESGWIDRLRSILGPPKSR